MTGLLRGLLFGNPSGCAEGGCFDYPAFSGALLSCRRCAWQNHKLLISLFVTVLPGRRTPASVFPGVFASSRENILSFALSANFEPARDLVRGKGGRRDAARTRSRDDYATREPRFRLCVNLRNLWILALLCQKRLRGVQSFIQLADILATAAGVVRTSPALAANNGSDALNDFSRLHLLGKCR